MNKAVEDYILLSSLKSSLENLSRFTRFSNITCYNIMANSEKTVVKEILVLLCEKVILCLQLAGHTVFPQSFHFE